jgi:hypothetical protein
VYASVVKLVAPGAYLAFVAGLAVLCVDLSRQVATQVAGLVAPHMTRAGERPPTLVERRQIAALRAVAPSYPQIARVPSVVDVPSVLEVPGVSARVLAERLDIAERTELASFEPRAKRAAVSRSRVSRPARPERVAAADVFGRSFGVLLVATR